MLMRSSKLTGAATLAAALLFGSTPAVFAQIEVPGDFVVLQDAIDAASAGDTILIDLGDYAAIVIDKPLTLVGRASGNTERARIVAPAVPMTPDKSQIPSVRLAGPGSGEVRLVNLELVGVTNGNALFTSNAPGLEGGGFDEVQVVNSFVEALRWEDPLGGGLAYPGIHVDVPFLLVANSTVIGGYPADDYLYVLPDSTGAPAIESSGDVAVIDATIIGGEAREMVFWTGMGPVPTDCDFDFAVTGFGGPAVRIDGDLFVASSELAAGEGAAVLGDDDDSQWFICQVTGSPVLEVAGAVAELPDTGVAGAPLILPDSKWELSWDTAAPGSILVFGFDAAAPIAAGGQGLLFADPSSLVLVPQPGFGPQTLDLVVRAMPGAEGLAVVVQRYSPSEGLSAPLVGAYVAP